MTGRCLTLGAVLTLLAPAVAFGQRDAGARSSASSNAADAAGDGLLGKSDGHQGDATSDSGADKIDWLPKLTVKITPAVAKLGDPITVKIVLDQPAEVHTTLPLKLELDPFVELGRQSQIKRRETPGKLPRSEQVFEVSVAVYKLGEQTLPPIELTALNPGGDMATIKTTAVPIRIVSSMPNEPQPKLKETAPPVSVFEDRLWPIYLICGLALLGLTVICTLLIAKRIRQRREALKPPPPPIPPEITARAALAALPVEELLAAGEYKELYLNISEIMRAYIGARHGFDALEMTTEEIDGRLAAAMSDAALRARCTQLWTDCDLVKFARVRPQSDDVGQTIAEAHQIIDATTPMPTAAVVEEGGDGQN
ncbi:MAG: hypothetical protein H6707_14275 [Deltaproteobacteria bacterium]|nr:hypothetical protein [Deltaproteobacteria bacterium]